MKKILDVCCGGRSFWYDKKNENTIYMDIRKDSIQLCDRKNKYAGTQIHGTFRGKDGKTHNRSETWKKSVCKEYGSRFNVWEISEEKNNRSGHPAPFPERLATDNIISWSNPEDVVLDPFLGSGTTGVAAVMNNRNFIGIEIVPEYFRYAEKRIAEAEKAAAGLLKF